MTTLLADGLLPAAILLGVPFLVGSSGSGPSGPIGAWRLASWLLPDVAFTLLAVAFGLLGLGALKLYWTADQRRSRPASVAT